MSEAPPEKALVSLYERIPIGGTKAPPIESVCFLVKDDDRRTVKEVRLPEAVDPTKAGTIDLGKIDIDFMHRPE